MNAILIAHIVIEIVVVLGIRWQSRGKSGLIFEMKKANPKAGLLCQI